MSCTSYLIEINNPITFQIDINIRDRDSQRRYVSTANTYCVVGTKEAQKDTSTKQQTNKTICLTCRAISRRVNEYTIQVRVKEHRIRIR